MSAAAAGKRILKSWKQSRRKGKNGAKSWRNSILKWGEILKNHDEKILNHDTRIGKLETVSGDRWNSVVNFALSGVVGALVAAAMHMLLGG